MDLNAIYEVARAVNKLADDGSIRYDDIDRAMVITIEVDGARHYGIDKELYRRTHNNSDEGFVHSEEPIEVNLFGVHFLIKMKKEKPLTK